MEPTPAQVPTLPKREGEEFQQAMAMAITSPLPLSASGRVASISEPGGVLTTGGVPKGGDDIMADKGRGNTELRLTEMVPCAG